MGTWTPFLVHNSLWIIFWNYNFFHCCWSDFIFPSFYTYELSLYSICSFLYDRWLSSHLYISKLSSWVIIVGYIQPFICIFNICDYVDVVSLSPSIWVYKPSDQYLLRALSYLDMFICVLSDESIIKSSNLIQFTPLFLHLIKLPSLHPFTVREWFLER